MEIKWGFVKMCIYFSALTAKINTECAFNFPLLNRHNNSLSYNKDSRMSEDFFTMKLFLHLKIGTLDQAKTFVPRQDLQILNRIFNAE